jgi:hypothetical protein
LVDDELRVTAYVEALDTKLDGDVEATEKGLVLRHVVRRREVQAYYVAHVLSEGEMKRRPAPAPVFITDLSKYMVQHSTWICVGGS